MRRLLVVCLIALIPLPALAAGKQDAISLSPGEAAFWSGPVIETAAGESWSYDVRVEEPAYRLRIGFDHPTFEDHYQVQIFNPDGESAGSIGPGNVGLYSAEFLRMAPEVGTWRVEVTAQEVADSTFRLRAKLEAREPSLGPGKLALPNLQ